MRFVDFDTEAAELGLLVVDFVVVCLDLPFDDLGAAAGDGPALLDARLGGLKGSWRFFCAGGSVIFAVDPLIKSIGCHTSTIARGLIPSQVGGCVAGSSEADAGRAPLRRGIR